MIEWCPYLPAVESIFFPLGSAQVTSSLVAVVLQNTTSESFWDFSTNSIAGFSDGLAASTPPATATSSVSEQVYIERNVWAEGFTPLSLLSYSLTGRREDELLQFDTKHHFSVVHFRGHNKNMH